MYFETALSLGRTATEALVSPRSSFSCTFKELLRYLDDKSRIAPQIPWAQSLGFMQEPVRPLEAGTLHPHWGIFSATRVNVECGADTNHQGYVESRCVRCHEALLLRRTQSHPEDVRTKLMNSLCQSIFFRVSQGAKGWGVCADNS